MWFKACLMVGEEFVRHEVIYEPQTLCKRYYRKTYECRNCRKKGTECFDEIVAHFGEKILDEKGELDRTKLSDIVFADEGLNFCNWNGLYIQK